jgi:hypothetical protein
MNREHKILLWCVLSGTALLSLALGEWAISEIFGYSNRDAAQWSLGVLGAVLLVATFVLREVFRNRQK